MNRLVVTFGGCVGVLGLYALATLPVLRTFPSVSPDEVNLYSAASTFARGQGMGTAVLAGFLPGIGHYTYWQPPGYFLSLALVLRFVSPTHHFLAMRLLSWFLGAIVLLLGANILKQLTPNWIAGLLGLAVLGTQVGFMQVANVGRMEMLSLAVTMAALSLYLTYREKRQRVLLALASLFAGIAVICHPAGILAGSVMVVHEVAAPAPSKSRWKDAGVVAGCAAAPLLPWLAYILAAPHFFRLQMAAQSTRKSLYVGGLLTTYGYKHWLMTPFRYASCPMGAPWLGVWPFPVGSAALLPLLLLCAGLAVLLATGKRRVEASLLGTWALAAYALNVFLPEYWYTVYFLTPSCLLLGWALTEPSLRWMRVVALSTLLAAGAWNFAEAHLIWWDSRDGWLAYRFYCLTLARMIPPRSTILLSAIPDPYFGLLEQDKSYRLYEFVPVGVSVDLGQADKVLDTVDYVVGSDCCRPRYLADYLLAHGRVVAELGSRDFLSPPVVLWKLHDRSSRPNLAGEKPVDAR